MFYAVDEDGKRVHIDSTQKTHKYFCPLCEAELIERKGKKRAHHFAHKGNTCTDSWHYDMSPWHCAWQNRFPLEYQEVVKEYNGKRHRADVLIEETKTVVEFQHSRLSSEEFDDRNTFYNSLGYRVIWVFDLLDAVERKEYLKPIDYAPKTLYYYDTREQGHRVEVFFQILQDAKDNPNLQWLEEYIKKEREKYGYIDIDHIIGVEDSQYYEAHQKDKIQVVSVQSYYKDSWATDNFLIKKRYSLEDFLEYANKPKEEKMLKSVFELWAENKPSIATFRDTKRDWYVRITKDPIEQIKKYNGRCYGKFSRSPKGPFNGEGGEVSYLEDERWELVWGIVWNTQPNESNKENGSE